MDSVVLQKSQKALAVQLTLYWVSATLVAILAALIFGVIFKFSIGGYNGTRAITFLLVLLLTAIATMIFYGKWQANTYVLRDEGIVVTWGFGDLSRRQKLYLYESIISVSINQEYFGKKYHYGDIHVTIPKLDRKLILKDISHPNQQMKALELFIKSKANAHNVLVT